MEKSAEINSERNGLWRQYVEKMSPGIEQAIRQNLPAAQSGGETVFISDKEHLSAVLTLLGAEIIGGKAEQIMPAAAAAEFVHEAALLLDDTEKQDAALLTALSLLNAAYGLLFGNTNIPAERAIQAHNELVEFIAAGGLFEGKKQEADPAHIYENERPGSARTSLLVRLALRTGAILAGADYLQLEALSRFAGLLGDAYQLKQETLALRKSSGSDENAFTAELEQNEASYHLNLTIAEAKRILTAHFPEGKPGSVLLQFADDIAASSEPV
jgi:geranylgeranyl diphosphate synthase type II